MSKKILFVIISLLIQLSFFPHPALAVSSCKGSKIDWDPKTFLEGQSQYTLNFTIQDTNTLQFLKTNGPYVRLLADRAFGNIGGTYTNPAVKIEDTKFSIALTGNLTNRSIHNGTLQYSTTENGSYFDFCSDVVYQIGSIGACIIANQSIPPRIPPNTSLTINFVGKVDIDYQLKVGNPDFLSAVQTIANSPSIPVPIVNNIQDIAVTAARAALLASSTIASIKTDSGGQGVFPPTIMPGNNGDKLRLVVYDPGNDIYGLCYKDTQIDATVPPPAVNVPGLVQPVPAAAAIKKCGDKDEHGNKIICAKGGGKLIEGCSDPNKPGYDPNNPGIATAIGCIHTNPVEFTKDILKFAIGIGGGLAFLMMLLGAYQMLTSAGNPDSLKAGTDRLTNAVIGLLFIIFSVLLMQIIGVGILNIPGFQ